jgi:hypothetical protein
VADEARLVELQRVHELDDEAAAIGDGIILRIVGETEPRLIERDHTEAVACEGRQIALEHFGRRAERRSVQQQNRRAAAFFEIPCLQSIDLSEVLRHKRSCV